VWGMWRCHANRNEGVQVRAPAARNAVWGSGGVEFMLQYGPTRQRQRDRRVKKSKSAAYAVTQQLARASCLYSKGVCGRSCENGRHKTSAGRWRYKPVATPQSCQRKEE